MMAEPSTSEMFTAATIAAGLLISKRRILQVLATVPASGVLIIGGNESKAWALQALPASLYERLEAERKRLGYRTIEDLLRKPIERWEPPLPLDSIACSAIQSAETLRRVQAPILGSMNSEAHLSVSEAEWEARGLEAYAAGFGHSISARHWRRLLKRTIERDRRLQEWSRLELYLPENPPRKAAPRPFQSVIAEGAFREITDTVRFKDPGKPSREEAALLWHRVFEWYENQTGRGRSVRRIKGRLLGFLSKAAPFLAANRNALRVACCHKYDRWIKGGREISALLDGREQRRGIPTAAPYPQEDIERIEYHTVRNCGGRVSQGVRELFEQDQLSPEVSRALMQKRARKSDIPGRLRERVRHDVKVLKAHHQGPRAAEKLIPPLDLDYDGIHSMKCLMADDFTMPVYAYVADGAGWFKLMRGQMLVVIDYRSLCILGYSLQASEQYNSAVIRTLFTRVFDQHGLPELLYLERGIWKSSKLITGGPKASGGVADLPYSEGEVEVGLRQFGIKFIHARRARSKPVERVGGLLQDLMHGEPGYCGREERKDKPESVFRAELEVKARKAHPSKYFRSFDEWEERLKEICEQYNKTRQEGKRLKGLSPEDAFAHFRNLDDPPTKFDASCRYLLAHHRIAVTIKPAGISFRVRNETFTYRDEQTGARIGRRMIAHFNPEIPEVLTVTDESRREAFTVERCNPVNALRTDGRYEEEVAKAQAHARYGKTLYRMLKLKYEPVFRKTVADRHTVELGRKIDEQQGAVKRRQSEENSRRNRVARQAGKVGVPASILAPASDVDGYARMMAEAEREERAHGKPTKGGG